MFNVRYGHSSSAAAGRSRAHYFKGETLSVDSEAERAAYYTAEVVPREMTEMDRLGRATHAGEISFEDALAEIMAAHLAEMEQQDVARHEANAAHLTAWVEGREPPDLDKLAGYAAHPEALISAGAIERKLTADLDVAIHVAELREAGIPPLTPEARAMHGLPEPAPVPEYLQAVPLAELRDRSQQIIRLWDTASAAADYRADVEATAEEGAEERLGNALADSAMRAAMRHALANEGGATADVKPDISPAMAKLLALDPLRPVTDDEMTNIFSGLTAAGEWIEGKKKQSAILSIAEVLGISDDRTPPTGEALQNILAGRRIDGGVPYASAASINERASDRAVGSEPPPHAAPNLADDEQSGFSPEPPAWLSEVPPSDLPGEMKPASAPEVPEGQKAIPQRLIDGARKRLLTALHVQDARNPSDDELARIKAGSAATEGMVVNPAEYSKAINAKKPPISYAEITLSPDKSLSVAWALAPTAAERTLLLRIHIDAVAHAMAYFESRVAFMGKGTNGKDGDEKGEMAWITYTHYTSRPTAEIAAKDKFGEDYTELQDVPLRHPDPHLHTHIIVPSVVLTESGRVGALDTDFIVGFEKEYGGVYQAFVAKLARANGIRIELGPSGEARLADVPTRVRDHFIKRTADGLEAAKTFAAEQGKDWDAMSDKKQLALLRKGVHETRNDKLKGPSDFAEWRRQAKDDLRYEHRSVLRPDDIWPELGQAERREVAYAMSLPAVETAFHKRAVIPGQDMRVAAISGLVMAGIENPAADIAAVTAAYREHGIRQQGEKVPLLWGKAPMVRGRERWNVTTALHLKQEDELITLGRAAAADRSAAIAPGTINKAVAAFLERNPSINPADDQWRQQRAMMDRLTNGGRLAVGIGAAGSGKSTVLAPLVDAWKAEGRKIYGIAVAHRTASAFEGSGITKGKPAKGKGGVIEEDRTAIAAFFKRVEKGRYALDKNAVVVVDEVSLVGTRQFLDLLKLRQERGFQLVAIGDQKQCQSVEAGNVIDLISRALPGSVPEIVTSIRQKHEREREIAGLFREGKAKQALDMKREDNTAILVAGGREATARRVADLWRERMEANKHDPDFTITVSAATREDARTVSAAIRSQLQAAGRIGADAVVVQAANNEGETYSMPIAPGDRILSLRQVFAARHDPVAVNGTVLTVVGATAKDITVKNPSGRVATLPWKAFSDDGGPVRIAPGFAATIDSQQGVTSTEHINAMLGGSAAVQGFKNYVAESRHRNTSWMVINEAAERRQISQGQHIGTQIDAIDVWKNVAANLSAQPVRASAQDFLKEATQIRRGAVSAHFRGRLPGEQRMMAGLTEGASVRDRIDATMPEVAAIAAQLRQLAQQAGHIVQHQMHKVASRTRGHRP